jgi:hypothetical protein
VLFDAKLASLRRHIGYLRDGCRACHGGAYPSLAARLDLLIQEVDGLERELDRLEVRMARYRAGANPAFDPWRQIFKDLRRLTIVVDLLRWQELPAHFARSADDEYFANVLRALHVEGGLADVHPVASLWQGHWFATRAAPPNYPLFFGPASVADDPGELPIVFHETGHVLFQLWDPELADAAEAVVADTLARKASELQGLAHGIRADFAAALGQWQTQAVNELEELVCDVVGVLLGGPAFVVSVAESLLAASSAPFEHLASNYPPLDCRMRLGGIVLRHRGVTSAALVAVEAGWAQVQVLHTQSKPRWYDWLYDDRYLGDMAAAVERVLRARGANPYGASGGGLRDELVQGADLALLQGRAAYHQWAEQFSRMLRGTYG